MLQKKHGPILVILLGLSLPIFQNCNEVVVHGQTGTVNLGSVGSIDEERPVVDARSSNPSAPAVGPSEKAKGVWLTDCRSFNATISVKEMLFLDNARASHYTLYYFSEPSKSNCTKLSHFTVKEADNVEFEDVSKSDFHIISKGVVDQNYEVTNKTPEVMLSMIDRPCLTSNSPPKGSLEGACSFNPFLKTNVAVYSSTGRRELSWLGRKYFQLDDQPLMSTVEGIIINSRLANFNRIRTWYGMCSSLGSRSIYSRESLSFVADGRLFKQMFYFTDANCSSSSRIDPAKTSNLSRYSDVVVEFDGNSSAAEDLTATYFREAYVNLTNTTEVKTSLPNCREFPITYVPDERKDEPCTLPEADRIVDFGQIMVLGAKLYFIVNGEIVESYSYN